MKQAEESGPRLRLLGMDAGGCTESCSEMHTFSWPCEQAMVDESYGPRLRWRITWRGGPVDLISRCVILFMAAWTVACVVTDWAAGAALGGLFVGFAWTLLAFLGGRFRASVHSFSEDEQ